MEGTRLPGRMALVAAVLVVVAACADTGGSTTTALPADQAGLPVTYISADGVETVITDRSRIVSLSGDFSEIIWELGLGDNLVGVDLSSVYPPDVMLTKPKVGVEFRLLTEPILVLEPTVVIGDLDAAPPAVIEHVRQAGVPVVIFPRFSGVSAPAEKIRETARVLGVSETGDALASRVQAEIDVVIALAADVVDRPRVAVVYVARPDTILLLGSGSLLDGFLAAVGAQDVGPLAGVDGMVPFTPEAIVSAAPDIIITASRGIDALDGLDGFLALPGIAQTPAGRDRAILVYDDLYLLGLGPRTGQVAMEILLALHPHLAPGG